MTDLSKDELVKRLANVFLETSSPPRDSVAREAYGERISALEVEVRHIREGNQNVSVEIRDFRTERRWIIGSIAAITVFILGAMAAGYFRLADMILKFGNLSGTPPSP